MTMTSPERCPDCEGKLGKDAVRCRCGWKLTVEGMVPAARAIPCDLKHMCDSPAKISVLVDGKRKNACMGCYNAHKDAELLQYNSQQSAEKRQANREQLKKILRMGSR